MADYAASHKLTALPGFLSGVAFATESVFGVPLPRGRRFERFYAGLQNYYADNSVSTPKAALTMLDLRAFARHLDASSFDDARDWCACLLAFFGLLRINEYMSSGLRVGDVIITSAGVDVTVLFSKTQSTSRTISLASRTDELCPASALAAYLRFFPYYRIPQRPTDPLFVTLHHTGPTPMTDAEFVDRLRSLIRIALPGRDPQRYAGHSFRRGGATALKKAGASDACIQRHGRWRSEAYRSYYDADDPDLRLLATAALRNHPSATASLPSSWPPPFPARHSDWSSGSPVVGLTSSRTSIGTPSRR